MEIETKALGRVEIKESQKIKIPKGLIGFEEYTDFALIESEYKPFLWLQSLQESRLAFLIVDPFLFCPDYEIDVDDDTLSSIGIDSPSKVMVMTIITIPASGKPITANMQGPLIINKENHEARQVVLGDVKWSTKYDIMKEKGKDLC